MQVSQTPNVTVGYVVAMRAGGRDQKRICFIYMKVAVMMIILVILMMMMIVMMILMMMMLVLKMGDGGDTWGTQYSWTVDKTACLRNIRSAAASPTSAMGPNSWPRFLPTKSTTLPMFLSQILQCVFVLLGKVFGT